MDQLMHESIGHNILYKRYNLYFIFWIIRHKMSEIFGYVYSTFYLKATKDKWGFAKNNSQVYHQGILVLKKNEIKAKCHFVHAPLKTISNATG